MTYLSKDALKIFGETLRGPGRGITTKASFLFTSNKPNKIDSDTLNNPPG